MVVHRKRKIEMKTKQNKRIKEKKCLTSPGFVPRTLSIVGERSTKRATKHVVDLWSKLSIYVYKWSYFYFRFRPKDKDFIWLESLTLDSRIDPQRFWSCTSNFKLKLPLDGGGAAVNMNKNKNWTTLLKTNVSLLESCFCTRKDSFTVKILKMQFVFGWD